MWRWKLGPYDFVSVASPELIARVIQQEGRYPVRVQLPHWKEYRDLRGQAYGLHVEWVDAAVFRSSSGLRHGSLPGLVPKVSWSPPTAGQGLSGPDSAAPSTPECWSCGRWRPFPPWSTRLWETFCDALNFSEVAARTGSPFQTSPLNCTSLALKVGTPCVFPGSLWTFFENCFFFNLFAGISAILFETRLGCLGEKMDPNVQRFISGVNDMLSLSDITYLFPRWTRSFIPLWKRFVQAWDDISDVGVQQKAAVLAINAPNLPWVSGSVSSTCSLGAHRQKNCWNWCSGGQGTVGGGAVPHLPVVLGQDEQGWHLSLHHRPAAGRSRHGEIPQESAENFTDVWWAGVRLLSVTFSC